MKKEEVYGHIDHTLLKAFSTTEQIEAIAEEALKYGTASICIPASFVNYIHNKYKDVNICTVIGFPLGYSTTSIKVAEAKQAIEDGANEIDMVINIGWAKEHNYGFHSLKIVLSQAIIPTTLGYAMCFTNAIGMFDLSCASAMIIAAMIGGSLGNTMGLPGLIIGCIAVGVVLGVINGTVYKLLKIPCLIVSLGLLLIYEILAQKIGLGVSKTIPADVGIIGKFPYSLIILGASALLFYYIYNKTCIACHIRAVGNEELLANALGVNAMNTKYMTFVLAGIFIGITAILQISYANSITTVSSLRSISMIFQPLMGVLIAFAIQEWCNLMLGVFISQFTLSMMFNALIALGVPSKMQDVVLGVMLIIVMGIALNNKRISGFFERKARRKELMKRA